jgi:hypothetical protein
MNVSVISKSFLSIRGVLMNKKTVDVHVSFHAKHCSRWLGLVLATGILLACGEDPQQLFETAQFEEQQHNQTHARELYERIIREHAKSPVAHKAEERLKEMQQANP